MNLEQFLASATFCLGLGVLVGVVSNWWSNRDGVKQMQDWEDELTQRELLTQQELATAEQVRLEALQLREDAERRYKDAAELVRITRRQLYGMAADSIELNDEMADTQLIDGIKSAFGHIQYTYGPSDATGTLYQLFKPPSAKEL